MAKMIRSVCIVGIVFLSTLSLAQTQQGYVKTKGRLGSNGAVIKGTRLTGAMVTVKGRNAVLSGSNGNFSLTIPGNTYYLQNVQKQGYVVTDPDILSRQYSYSKNPLVLVLETQEERTDDKLVVERKIRRNLQRQLQQREDEIEALKEEKKITKQEYQEQLKKLYDEQESNEKLISGMVERYAKIDYDQVDEFNTLISKYILDGELTKADSLLRTKGDINSRTVELRQLQNQNFKDEIELKKRKKKLEKNKSLAQKELENIAQDCYSKFEIFKLKHQNDSALYYVTLRSSLDTLNTGWRIDEAEFIQTYIADYSKALEIYRATLGNLNKSVGEDNLDAIILYNNIGQALNEKGEYQQAEQSYSKAIYLTQKVFGNNHPAMSTCLNNRGHVYLNMGRNEDAQRCFEQSLTVQTTNSDDSIRCFINLGALNIHKGHLALARNYYDSALALILRESKPNTIREAACYNGIALIMARENNYDESISYYEKSLELNLKTFGKDHPDVALNYSNIGSTLNDLGKYKEALEYLNKALEIETSVYGSRHPNTAYTYTNIGFSFRKLGEYDKAMEYYKEALAVDLDYYGEVHRRVATDLINIGGIYSSEGDNQKALEYNQKALKILEVVLDDNHPTLATCLNNIGDNYIEMGEYPQAIACLEKALQIDIANYGEKHVNVATTYNNLGNVYNKMGDFGKAAMYLEKVFPILTNALGENHPNVAITYYNVSVLHKKQGNYQKSLEMAEKAYDILSKTLPEGHPNLKTIKDGMEEIKSKIENAK